MDALLERLDDLETRGEAPRCQHNLVQLTIGAHMCESVKRSRVL
jgi:hypothetical protein